MVAAVPPTLTSILAGNTLTPVDVPDLLNCGQITLNFLGYASFSCTGASDVADIVVHVPAPAQLTQQQPADIPTKHVKAAAAACL